MFDGKRKIKNPISISQKWPILTVSSLFEKQHISPLFKQQITTNRFRDSKSQCSELNKSKNILSVLAFSSLYYIQ